MKKFMKKLVLPVTLLGLAACDPNAEVKNNKEVVEFYHAFFHEESVYAPSKVMRDLYDDFAKTHNNETIEFKPISVNGNIKDVMNNKVANGEFPAIIDLAGHDVSLAAISQNLVLDMKPFIDKNNLQKNIGINYIQNNKNGKIYSVHDQLVSLGLWYNTDIFKKAGASLPDTWKDYNDFGVAMSKVRQLDGVYGFGAGEPAIRIFNAVLGLSEEGRGLLTKPLTKEGIESKAFENALRVTMREVQANGSNNAGGNANIYTADFVNNKSAVFFNGVWAASELQKIKPYSQHFTLEKSLFLLQVAVLLSLINYQKKVKP
ncbi:ABC transporter substrate-binding protein [Pasteurella atlantica]|uniref:ABC transporter substrate-binding protein n=1 Tax=Phocoenobacter atlanticus TaxID=3416742 RepID=UPI00275A4483|nr:ABC transporter substrate-binding protein [Pasteurella atlantica]MDP8161516.1 ABC transporter substrate-binding protein [Pasteurella atlantica]